MKRKPNYYSDTIDPVFRSRPDEVFLITIEAKPKLGSKESREFAGAYCNCWVNAEDLRTAERRTVQIMKENNWIAYRFDEWSLVDSEFYRDWKPKEEGDLDISGFADQALVDGAVLVSHTFPIDAPDANDTD